MLLGAVEVDGPSIPEITAAWAERDGCKARSQTVEVTADVDRITWPCPKGVEVDLYRVTDGGHSWPGSPLGDVITGVVGKTTTTISANAVIWSFFQHFRLYTTIESADKKARAYWALEVGDITWGNGGGANAGSTFVLVYNLYNTDDLYERFPAGEGQLYFVGGFNASYVRRGNVVLIPIRVGAGLRMGVNAGYLKFSKKQTWLPF